jgi:hypothetical protein
VPARPQVRGQICADWTNVQADAVTRSGCQASVEPPVTEKGLACLPSGLLPTSLAGGEEAIALWLASGPLTSHGSSMEELALSRISSRLDSPFLALQHSHEPFRQEPVVTSVDVR